jgi:hypothetical protein
VKEKLLEFDAEVIDEGLFLLVGPDRGREAATLGPVEAGF